MALFLVQHGKNLPKDVDEEKGLSDEGAAEVKNVAQTAKAFGLTVSEIRHSGKKRAHQTAEIYSQILNDESIPVEKSEGMGPLDDVADYVSKISDEKNIMLVGHLPFLERMISYLITQNTETPVFKFQNGAIVGLNNLPDSGAWVIRSAISPALI